MEGIRTTKFIILLYYFRVYRIARCAGAFEENFLNINVSV